MRIFFRSSCVGIFIVMMLCIHTPLSAQTQQKRAPQDYKKTEYRITMRDGVTLYTAVYVPNDASASKTYPILMQRTPYTCEPYGADKYPQHLGPSVYMQNEGFIFVYQDVRGRYMSDGTYDNMRPQSKRANTNDIDESTDTYDTIEWLLKNISFHNGSVGQWGISYPGYYTAVGTIARHSALKASSPQAPIADFFFDDFHHRGAFVQGYFHATSLFTYQKTSNTTDDWWLKGWPKGGAEKDGYQFHLNLGPLKNGSRYYGADAFFWNQLVEHPNYDDFWQKRNLLPHLTNIDHAVMTVGGWFDAEDLYGPLNIYKTIEKTSPTSKNTIVMGPWSHGQWASENRSQSVGNWYFGEGISDYYQREIEVPFFVQYLKGLTLKKLPEAHLYDAGAGLWKSFDTYPVASWTPRKLYLRSGGNLSFDPPISGESSATDYVSDPHKPVPYRFEIEGIQITPKQFMTDDQRATSRRPDVLSFQTDTLTEDITLGGELLAHLIAATTQSDADFIVKLIDVYPDTAPQISQMPKHIPTAGYQFLVRSEVMRGRFRKSFTNPEAFVPNKAEEVEFPLQDVLYTFKKGHRLMVQIHSTWFPYIDRNPQKYVENIFKADEKDFVRATHTVMHSPQQPSYLQVHIVK